MFVSKKQQPLKFTTTIQVHDNNIQVHDNNIQVHDNIEVHDNNHKY